MPQNPYNSAPDVDPPFPHVPVLHTTVLTVLAPRSGERVLDVTLGLGGHAQLFLEAIGSTGTLIGLDTDERNLTVAKEKLEGRGATELFHASFRDLPALNLPEVDILFADLGLSSPHLDDPTRGFSFRFDGPLDMRLDASKGITAEQLILRSSAEELGHIFADYGQFAGSMRLGRTLAGSHVATTTALREAVEKAFGFKGKALLPQVFQALRIAVNQELDALNILLEHGPKMLRSGGRMGVISFHSLEDRAVKHTFRALTTAPKDPVTGKIAHPADFTLLTPHALAPSPDEITDNPRSRSAKFRAIRRS